MIKVAYTSKLLNPKHLVLLRGFGSGDLVLR